MKYLLICMLFPIVVSIPAGAQIKTQTQQKTAVFDYGSSIHVQDWWVDNKEVKVSLAEDRSPGSAGSAGSPGSATSTGSSGSAASAKFLHVAWDAVPAGHPNVWLTDIKIDTVSNPRLAPGWNSFKENTWLSIPIRTGEGDSVYLQFVIFTKDEKDKWGSRETIGFRSSEWQSIKVRLGALHFDNWGKGKIATPDLNSIVPARIEIGIRTAKSGRQGMIDLSVGYIAITNYEPGS